MFLLLYFQIFDIKIHKLTEKTILNLKKIFSTYKKIVILTHINPDGDAIGASLSMCLYLKQKNREVEVITPNELPSFLKWMPESDKIIETSKQTDKANKLIKEAEMLICLDFNSLNRIEKLAEVFVQSTAYKLLIDHHIEPENFADLTISNCNISSTSELVFDLIEKLGDVHLINKAIAECLYVGIATDTGSFSYSCNYPETYQIVSKLVSIGIDTESIHRMVYDTYSEDRMRLLGFCLVEKMRVFPKYNTAFISLSKDEMKRFNFQAGDSEGIVNYPLSIGSVQMAALFIEKEDHVRISIRSKGEFSVNTIAKKYFNGGGHKNAAGGNSNLSLEETIKKFIMLLPELNY